MATFWSNFSRCKFLNEILHFHEVNNIVCFKTCKYKYKVFKIQKQ